MSTATHIRTTHVNATEGYIYSEYDEPIGDYADDNGRVDMGEFYRAGVVNFGRCTSKVYVDSSDGVRHVGYCFQRRERYEDTGESYLRETWVVLLSKSIEYVAA